MPGVELTLAEVPDLGGCALGDTPRGEIWIRGPCVFSGYFKDPELTSVRKGGG